MKYIFKDETIWEKFLDLIKWYSIENFFINWIYPAYNLQNLIFHRHDRIKIPQVKPWEYTDILYFMLCANMEMIVKFIEKEKPEKHILWYKDEEGKDVGHKYGEYDMPIIYPYLKDKWIMDIIKEIYNWWKTDYPILLLERDHLLHFWCDYILGDVVFEPKEDNDELSEIIFDKSNLITDIDKLKQQEDLDWTIISKYIKDENKIFDEQYVHDIIKKLEQQIFNQEQYYLHLCIEVRPYLWT